MTRVETNFPQWSAGVRKFSAMAGTEFVVEFKNQARLLFNEIINRTPPFSGGVIFKMIAAAGHTVRDQDVEKLSALAVGKRRVEKDVRKVLYGVKGASLKNARDGSGNDQMVFTSQNNQADPGGWLVEQKCLGKSAWRIFATQTGEVYGVDRMHALTYLEADANALTKLHDSQRTKRGRVTMAGKVASPIGRWRWVEKGVVKESVLKKFLRKKQRAVGQARGGWAAAYIKLGGRMSSSGWVGRHAKAGSEASSFQKWNCFLTGTNKSRWASAGDPDRVIAKSMEQRTEALKAACQRLIEGTWRKFK